MKAKALFPIVVLILLAVSIIHKIRQSAVLFTADERTPSPAPASAPPVRSASTAPPAPTTAPTEPVSDSMAKIIQTTDAALQRIRNDPTLTLLERRQRETELATLRHQMITSELAVSRLKKHQAAQTATPAAPAPAPPDPMAPGAPSYAPSVQLAASSSITHAATGILELDSKPGGAEVFVDGKKKGTTPETEGRVLKMELAEGDHEVLLKKEGGGSITKKVFIGAGVTQPLTLTIAQAGFTNSLGMKFVPVPGTQILMCIHETRNKDYARYAAENSGVDSSWQFKIKHYDSTYISTDHPENPVVKVNWKEATDFCAWLSRKDGRVYRLPTDHEWSCAVGIGDQEDARATPEEKDGKVSGFPWGTDFPPPGNNVGNYLDVSADPRGAIPFLRGYNDGSVFMAPVMSYPPNKLGIYDLGGNVWEWCQDKFSPDDPVPVLRGGAWDHADPDNLASSRRRKCDPTIRNIYGDGFRCVVLVDSAK